jgi:UDP-2,3-diacylglucosamine pyrophosphatase LpxH
MFKQVFVIAHIPPFGDQFTDEMEQTYKSLQNQNNVSLSIHGHTHSFLYEQNTVSYLTVPSLKEPAYCIINVQNESFNVELIEL